MSNRTSKPKQLISNWLHEAPTCDQLSTQTRSTSALLLQQQPATISLAARAFCAAAPTVWNSVGVHTRSADTFFTSKNRLKTELFKFCYS